MKPVWSLMSSRSHAEVAHAHTQTHKDRGKFNFDTGSLKDNRSECPSWCRRWEAEQTRKQLKNQHARACLRAHTHVHEHKIAWIICMRQMWNYRSSPAVHIWPQ